MMDIYVGNLHYSTTEEELEDLFGKHGNVRSVRIAKDESDGRPKGFASVLMESGGEQAISSLHGTNFKGRPITVGKNRNRRNPRDRR